MNIKPVLEGFGKGVKYLTFFPNIPRRDISIGNAWASVGKAFQRTGDSIRKAMHEQPAPTPKTAK